MEDQSEMAVGVSVALRRLNYAHDYLIMALKARTTSLFQILTTFCLSLITKYTKHLHELGWYP